MLKILEIVEGLQMLEISQIFVTREGTIFEIFEMGYPEI